MDRVGPFVVERVLGSGGMGVVYLGHREGDPEGSKAAVKVVRVEFAADPEFRRRFSREVTTAMRVEGPYTARVLAADLDAQVPWMATEYVAGVTLAEQVGGDGPLAGGEVVGFARQLAAALDSIHRVGLIHRDLKPSNVMVTDRGPVVLDYGISHALESTAITMSGLISGSPAWLSPEQLLGTAETPALDMFAWGCVVTYAAVGRHPFGQGRAEALAYRIMHTQPDLGDMAPPLERLVASALVLDPSRRPTSSDVVEVLDAESSERRPLPGPPALEEHRSTSVAGDPSVLHLPAQADGDAGDSQSPPGSTAAELTAVPSGPPEAPGAGTGSWRDADDATRQAFRSRTRTDPDAVDANRRTTPDDDSLVEADDRGEESSTSDADTVLARRHLWPVEEPSPVVSGGPGQQHAHSHSRRRMVVGLAATAMLVVGVMVLTQDDANYVATMGDSRLSLEEVAAQVAAVHRANGEPVDQVDEELTRATVERLTREGLVAQGAERLDVTVDQGAIDRALASLADERGGRENLEKVFLQDGVPAQAIPQTVAVRLKVEGIGQALAPGGAPKEQQQAVFDYIVELSDELGVTVSPRYGTWDPVNLSLDPPPTVP